MAGSIVCGVDDSSSAKGAARVARALAAQLGLEIVFVRVVEADASEAKVNAITERLERLRAGAEDLDCGAAWLLETGHPADRLVAVAEAGEATLIVMGSTGPRSSLLGSISADVSKRAPCPVVVVPPGADVLVNGREHSLISGPQNPPGGIVRFANEGGASETAGGIVRFGLGGDEGER
jgi:nucleotide-binding universal stress UspA family protein